MNVYNDQNQESSVDALADLDFPLPPLGHDDVVTWQRLLFNQIQQLFRVLPENGKIVVGVVAALIILAVIGAIIRLIAALIGLALVVLVLLVLYQFFKHSQVMDR